MFLLCELMKFVFPTGKPTLYIIFLIKYITYFLYSRHGMSTIVMKIRELALANASDATALVFGKLTKAGARENIKPQDSSCVVVTRNMAQWKASLENYEPFQPNILCPKGNFN